MVISIYIARDCYYIIPIVRHAIYYMCVCVWFKRALTSRHKPHACARALSDAHSHTAIRLAVAIEQSLLRHSAHAAASRRRPRAVYADLCERVCSIRVCACVYSILEISTTNTHTHSAHSAHFMRQRLLALCAVKDRARVRAFLRANLLCGNMFTTHTRAARICATTHDNSNGFDVYYNITDAWDLANI